MCKSPIEGSEQIHGHATKDQKRLPALEAGAPTDCTTFLNVTTYRTKSGHLEAGGHLLFVNSCERIITYYLKLT